MTYTIMYREISLQSESFTALSAFLFEFYGHGCIHELIRREMWQPAAPQAMVHVQLWLPSGTCFNGSSSWQLNYMP